jgi:hypothetical protein
MTSGTPHDLKETRTFLLYHRPMSKRDTYVIGGEQFEGYPRAFSVPKCISKCSP